MWNEQLKTIDSIHTPIAAAKRWGKDIQHVHLVNAGINLVYRFEYHHQTYYLRITHAKLRSKSELEAALTYQKHLFEHHAPVCEPVISIDGLWFESIWQGEEEFLAHVCKEVPGKPITFSEQSIETYKTWGKALGQLHHAASTYDYSKYHYATWSESLKEMSAYAQKEPAIRGVLASVSEFLNTRAQAPFNYGLTHGDHREGNVLTDGKHVHIIDFDLPSLNWLTEDLFRPFFDSIVHDQTNWRDKVEPYLNGYFSVMPEDSIDLSTLPWQIKMKCLEIYLWTKNNWSDESAPGGEDTSLWLKKIYNKIVSDDWIPSLTL